MAWVDEVERLKTLANPSGSRRRGRRHQARYPQCDLVGIGIKELYAEGSDRTEDLVCMSGENTNPYGWTFTDRMIRPGDLVYVDVDGASYRDTRPASTAPSAVAKPPASRRPLRRGQRDAARRHGVVNDGATDHDVLAKWPDSRPTGALETWPEVNPYACGHGLGLTLHDRPMIRCPSGPWASPRTRSGGDGHGLRDLHRPQGRQARGADRGHGPGHRDRHELLSKFPQELIECWTAV